MEENQQNNFNFVDTTATRRVFELTKRIRAVCGGTSASKTISILIWLIDYCQVKNKRPKLCTVVSESYPHLEKGTMLDFQNIMKDRGYWNDSRWNKTKHSYSFETGNTLEFFSVDTYGKAHGLRRDVLFVNECNNVPFSIVDQLIVRTREIIWLDWNPTSEFWIYTEVLPKRNDVDFITLTYKDNEALDINTIKEIETRKDNKNWWKVYGLGQLGEIEARVYTGWNIIDEVPESAKLVRYGLDFGYSQDPTVIIAVYYLDNGFIIDELVYLKRLSNRVIADILLNKQRALVIADSSEPKSIDEIASYGVSIIGSKKGSGSVNQGIQYVQEQKISITKRSINTIKAYRNYIFITDKNNKVINEPDDTVHEWSNAMDAIRYAISSLKATEPKPIQTDFGGAKPYISGML